MNSSKLQFLSLSGTVLCWLLASHPTLAEIVPDTTLPVNSTVTSSGNIKLIEGGTRRSDNLFHSFREFSFSEGTAFFNNDSAIRNIITRVTGGSPSNINGIIQANGAANLFFINPNGIIFGPKASLQIGGSFVASTANSLKFADGTEFSATTPQTSPLLTVSVPLGLQFGSNPREIVNQSQASPNGAVNSIGSPVGLQVQSGKTLALVGGNVSLENGNLTAAGGRIELGSVASDGFVNLNEINTGYALAYPGVQNFGDIQLSGGAFVDASGFGGGAIQLQGRNITLADNSQIISITSGSKTGEDLVINAAESLKLSGGSNIATFADGEGQAGNVLVRAKNSVELVGTASDASPSALASQVCLFSDCQSVTGNGGNLTIDTDRLLIKDGANVTTSTFGAGQAGNTIVKASDAIDLIGAGADGAASGIFTQVAKGAIENPGNAGTLTLETRRLSVQGGAQISTVARNGGNGGNGGNLTINASDSILLSGTSPPATASPLDSYRSGIFVSAEPGARANGGNLNLNTGLLAVENGARISADNFGSGQGGNATLNLRQLVVRDGGEVRAGSFASGPGGTLTVNATESVQVTGTGTIASTPVSSTLFTQAQASGKAGNLSITTPNLKVQDGAEVTVSGKGSGSAGNLTITANDLRLNRGRLTAETNAGEGANIKLERLGLLLLQNQSLISARAFNNAKGGNINIDAAKGVVVAVPNQNNDIIASAVGGQGGKIDITTQGIFGIGERKATPGNTTNDIDASSEFNKSGTVTINTPDVDPIRSLFTLSTGVVDASNQVAPGCAAFAGTEGNEFIVTGRGGLPPSPDEPLSSDVVWSDTRLTSIGSRENLRTSTTTPQVPPQRGDRIVIVPATGWVFNKDKGEVTLIAQSPNGTAYGSGYTPASCPRHLSN